MRSYLSFVAVVAIAMPVVAAKPTATPVESAAKQIVGAWKLEFTTPDNVERTPIVLVGRQHQELVAWYVDNEKPEAFKKVRLDEDELLLTIRPKERKDIEVTFKASLKKEDVCAGEATYRSDDGDSGSWDFKGKRASESDFDATEKWNISFVTPGDVHRKATVTVLARKDRLYGWYSSKELDLPATKFTKDGNKVVMSMQTKTKDGAKVDVTFRGAIDGNSVEGDAEYDLEGETGSVPFEGKRKS